MRVFLHGEGDPIPIQALPDELPISDRPPLTFLFDASQEFPVADYVALEYTNFEVICIGASGGRGGGALNQLTYDLETVTMGVPQWVWDLHLERAMLNDWFEQRLMGLDLYYNDPNFYNPSGWPPGYVRAYGINPTGRMFTPELDRWYPSSSTYSGSFPYMLTDDTRYFRYLEILTELQVTGSNIAGLQAAYPAGFTYKQVVEFLNPTHQMTFKTLKNVRVVGTPTELGGAGGGGGRHVVGGLLAELPDSIAVVVGQAGADAEHKQGLQEGLLTPALTDPQFFSVYPHYNETSPSDIAERRRINVINNIITAFTVTYPEPHLSFPNPLKGQDGGASSFGDIAQASGGVGGEKSIGWPGGARTLLGYGAEGGSGGRTAAGGGGAGSTASGIPGADGSWDGAIGKGGGGGLSGKAASPIRAASTGGRGSYSFADPSVYGPRQGKSGLVPGGGGGALLLPGPPPQYYGSDAVASNPNGVVYLRLTKVD